MILVLVITIHYLVVDTLSNHEALESLTKYFKDKRMVKLCLALSAVMRALGRRLER